MSQSASNFYLSDDAEIIPEVRVTDLGIYEYITIQSRDVTITIGGGGVLTALRRAAGVAE